MKNLTLSFPIDQPGKKNVLFEKCRGEACLSRIPFSSPGWLGLGYNIVAILLLSSQLTYTVFTIFQY